MMFFPLFFVYPAVVPVKMSVGTETEKFWDSLWELQAECTGLLWVERHPWARGDLDQSAHELDASGDKTSQSERQTGKKETSTENQHHTTLHLSERGDTEEKEEVHPLLLRPQ